MVVHVISSLDEYKKTLEEHPVILIDAFAIWCGPCKAVAPLMERWSDDPTYQSIYFANFDVDVLPDLAQELGVTAMPTFTFFKDGKHHTSIVGARIDQLVEQMNQLCAN